MDNDKSILYSVTILLSALILSACSGKSDTTSIVYGLTLAPSGIDPHLNASAELGIPLTSVYDTLVFQDPATGEFIPGLAERWTITADGLAYTFHLRDDVTFHDGTSFNADSVIANIEYTLDPDNHSFKAALMLGPLSNVEKVDEYTVSFHLSEPFAPLLDSLSQVYLGMASPLALETWGATEYQFHQVGSGPYKFVEYVPNDHLTLTRNEDYDWAPSIYREERANIETIEFRFYEDPATRALALESGEVDIIGEVPHPDATRLESDERFNLNPIPIPGQPLQYIFNTQISPTNDLRVRQALIAAVDRPTVVATVFGKHSPVAESALTAVTKGYSAEAPFPSYDPDRASDLLDSAGWSDDDGNGIRTRDSEPLRIHIIAPPWGSNSEVAQLLRAAWEKVGASVELEIAPGFGPLTEAQSAGEYHLIGINFFDSDPDLLRSFFTSDGFYNWSGYANPELDQYLIRAAQASLDPELRWNLYAWTTAHIRDQALILPIRDYINLVVSSSQLQDLRFSAQGWFPLLIDLKSAP